MKKFLVSLFTVLNFSACTERVPAGHVGRIQSPSGFEDDLLRPGNHSAWGRDRLYLMETTDVNVGIPMDVLCKDSLNFKFTIDLLVSLDLSNPATVKQAFEDLKPAQDNVITVKQLFDTYIKANAAQEAQKVISKYPTSEIVEKRSAIIEEVGTAVIESSKNGLIRIKRVALSNLDFPDIITKAQEQKAERIVQIETAKADGDKAIAKGRAELQLAQIAAQKTVLEAQAVADANKIIASSITPNYLAYEQIRAMSRAAEGNNNVFFFPYEDGINKQIDSSRWANPQFMIDSDVMQKLNDARKAAEHEGPKPETDSK